MTVTVKLGDVVDVASGQVDPREEPYCDLPHVGGDNIESGTGELSGLRTARELNLISGKYLFGPDDVLYSKIRPALNKVALPSFRGICSADMYPLRPRADRLERRFLAYLLRQQLFLSFAEKHSTRTNIPKLNRTALLSFEFPLPSLSEQRRIADILDKADGIRRKRKEAIALTEDLLRSAFLEMFGDPVTNPKGWDVMPLGDSTSLIDYGVTASAREDAVGPKFLRITDIQDNRVNWTAVPYCKCESGVAERARLATGDIVFARTGATTGKSFWIRDCPDRAVFASYLIRVRPNGRLASGYLAEFFQSRAYWSQIRAMAQGAAQPGVNASKLAAVKVPVPPIALQKQFELFSFRAYSSRQRLEDSLPIADSLFESVVQRAFRGELAREGGTC